MTYAVVPGLFRSNPFAAVRWGRNLDYSRMTSWVLVGLAGTDEDLAQREFALRYEKFVRRILAKRWLGTVFRTYFDDAIQEVFVECFKPNGVIEKANAQNGNSFRTYLFQVASHVAARFERTHQRQQSIASTNDDHLDDLSSQAMSAYDLVTREEVADLVREALHRMTHHYNPEVRKRGQLLDRHTCQGEKIIAIADGNPDLAEQLHRDHTKAKREWKSFLVEVVQSEYRVPGNEAQVIVSELLGAFQ